MIRRLLLACFCLAVTALLGAQSMSRVTGTIAYRERIAMQPGWSVVVTLEDVSRADAPADAVAGVHNDRPGQVPLKFELPYDASKIDASHRYAVRAKILDGERVVFETTQTYLVLTQGHGSDVTVMLTMAPASPPPAPATNPAPATKPTPPAASGAVAEHTPVPPVRTLPPPVTLTNLPATFTGTLPCADCPGIKWQLDLFGDDSFLLRTSSLDRPAPPQDDFGSWALSSDRRLIALKGQRDALVLLSIRDNATLRQLDSDGREMAGATQADLHRGPFEPLDVRGTMKGAYRVDNGHATFVECTTGQRWTVADGAAGSALAAAYTKIHRQPDEAMMATIDGSLTRAAAGAPASEPALVVNAVTHTSLGESCAPRFATSGLAGTTWTLTRLGDQPVTPAQGQKSAASLTFEADSPRFAGAGGCNRLIGTYVIDRDRLSLNAAGTMMACHTGMETETAFAAALKHTVRYRIVGHTLQFEDASGSVVATFVGA